MDVYIHQMIYSFERQPKILTALEDTLKVTDHKMKNCIIAAIQEMQYGTTKDVYRMALKNIEKEYACSRITTLHKVPNHRGKKKAGSIKVHWKYCGAMQTTG